MIVMKNKELEMAGDEAYEVVLCYQSWLRKTFYKGTSGAESRRQ